MILARPEDDSAWDRISQRLLKILHTQGIKSPYDRWYLVRAEQYLKAFPGKSPKAHGVEDVIGYLRGLGRKTTLKDWQYRQAVDAIRILLVSVLELPCASALDGEYGRDSARSLEAGHATLARDTAQESVLQKGNPGGVNRGLEAVRKAHAGILTALITEIRRRAYSIRTEQAYEQWVCRFIAFSGHRDPREQDTAEVRAFLEHLAVQGKVAASTQNQALNALVFPVPSGAEPAPE